MRIVPEYRSPDTTNAAQHGRFRSIAIALWSGAIPLAAGILIFLFWLITRWALFQLLGLLTILAGLVLVGGGGICWLLHLIGTLRQPPSVARRRQFGLSALAAVVLLANFPACAVILTAVERIESSFTVQVRNTGTKPITGVAISYGGNSWNLGAIAPGAAMSKQLTADAGGPVDVAFIRADGSQHRLELQQHVDSDEVYGNLRLTAQISDDGMKAFRTKG